MSKNFDVEIGGGTADFNLEMEAEAQSFDVEFQTSGAPSPGTEKTKLSQFENDILRPMSAEDIRILL